MSSSYVLFYFLIDQGTPTKRITDIEVASTVSTTNRRQQKLLITTEKHSDENELTLNTDITKFHFNKHL